MSLKHSSIIVLVAFFATFTVNAKINTVSISTTTLSPDCLEYRIVGICYWLTCSSFGCKVKTSVKVKHYIPDAVVTSYVSTGNSPWTETSIIGTPIPGAQSGSYVTTNQANENSVAKFNNVDVIGHPGISLFNNFVRGFGYSCDGAGQAFMPYFISTLDTLGWRYNIPEAVYPESLLPGMREIGARASANLWGNVYPRGGFTHQADDYKAAATNAQRAGDIVTRRGQPHVYQPLLGIKKDGYWPAGELIESKKSTGKWQSLAPKMESSCRVFPDTQTLHEQAKDGAYAWSLWRPYSCCKRRGQTFLGSIDF